MEIEYELIARERTALGELQLRRYVAATGEEGYEVLIDDRFLMASHGSHSERAMAGFAHSRLTKPAEGLVALIGGLGAGHTLRATLDLEGIQRVVVAEIGRKMLDWNRRYFASVNGNAVDDPRVEVRVGDLWDEIRRADNAYDLMLLDVDNGPGWLAADGNARLYDDRGLDACRRALAPGGVLAIWSPTTNPELTAGLRRVFKKMEAVDTTDIAKTEHEPGSVIYLARASLQQTDSEPEAALEPSSDDRTPTQNVLPQRRDTRHQ